MKYVYLIEGKVHEIIPEDDPVFPGIPITERYSQRFLADCVTVEDDTPVHEGMLYQDDVFVEPPQSVGDTQESGIVEELLAAGKITAEEYKQITGQDPKEKAAPCGR